ncbi:MAG: hypothetical protein CME64_14615 [Halobacteriovoraceae bacterium]|nr:hypothetical protein [Halobacteriovoraceae bacterium]|tara:strand:+ start:123851 stop:124192 length:342 start_codon:yes stop_codon:yes gene_type:complete
MKKVLLFLTLFASTTLFASDKSFTACDVEYNDISVNVSINGDSIEVITTSPMGEHKSKGQITKVQPVSKATTIYFTNSDIMYIHSANNKRNELTVIDATDPAPALRYSSEYCN